MMWRYEVISLTKPHRDHKALVEFVDPTVYLNQLEESGHDTDALTYFADQNSLLIRHRKREAPAPASPAKSSESAKGRRPRT